MDFKLWSISHSTLLNLEVKCYIYVCNAEQSDPLINRTKIRNSMLYPSMSLNTLKAIFIAWCMTEIIAIH